MNNRYFLLGLFAACAALIVENVDARTRRGGNKNAVESFIIYNKMPYRVSVVFQDEHGDSLPYYVDNNASRTFKDQLKDVRAAGVSFVMQDQTESDPEYIGISSQMKGIVVQNNGTKKAPTMKLTPLLR